MQYTSLLILLALAVVCANGRGVTQESLDDEDDLMMLQEVRDVEGIFMSIATMLAEANENPSLLSVQKRSALFDKIKALLQQAKNKEQHVFETVMQNAKKAFIYLAKKAGKNGVELFKTAIKALAAKVDATYVVDGCVKKMCLPATGKIFGKDQDSIPNNLAKDLCPQACKYVLTKIRKSVSDI